MDALAGVKAGNISTAIFGNPVDAVSSYEIKQTLVARFAVILVTEKAKTRFLTSDLQIEDFTYPRKRRAGHRRDSGASYALFRSKQEIKVRLRLIVSEVLTSWLSSATSRPYLAIKFFSLFQLRPLSRDL